MLDWSTLRSGSRRQDDAALGRESEKSLRVSGVQRRAVAQCHREFDTHGVYHPLSQPAPDGIGVNCLGPGVTNGKLQLPKLSN